MGKPLEVIFWSIALPGFGQLSNGKIVKGIAFIVLEFIINVQAGFNELILLSFHGEIDTALSQANYQWLMFYPCIYFFAMWDAYRDASGGRNNKFTFLPFVFAAYFVTVGLIYAPKVAIFGQLLGPVWLPMLFALPGVIIGFLLLKIGTKIDEQKG